jgi:hypothetical protein
MMRITMIAVSVLVAATTGAIAKDRIPLMPDQAVLACNARAWHEMERQNYSTAEPIKRFKVMKLQDGWRVRGAYLARHEDVEQQFDTACDVSADGVDLVATVRAD